MAVEFKVVEDNTDKMVNMLDEAIKAGLEKCGKMAQQYAKIELGKPKEHKTQPIMRPNIDTGRLVNSIDHKMVSDTAVAIGTNVEYSGYLELGTSRMRAYPYLKPAINEHIAEYQSAFESELKSRMK